MSEEAADWLLKLNENPHDRDLVERFQSWRAQAPENEIAWDRTCKAWQGLGILAPEHLQPGVRSDGPQLTSQQSPVQGTTDAIRPRRIPGRRVLAFSAVALAASIIVLLAPTFLMRFQADHFTRTGEIRTVVLEDGSRVTLAGASAIKIRKEEQRLLVDLIGGEAFFDVVHDAGRRFTVTASDLRVTVLGTQFNVRLGEETTDAALLEGSVDADTLAGVSQATRLSPGQLIELNTADRSTEVFDIDPAHIGAWRERRLFISDQTVASVAEQIGRYQPGWVSIPDQSLASMRVTGVYDLSDPDRALRALVAPFGGEVIEISDYLSVLARVD